MLNRSSYISKLIPPNLECIILERRQDDHHGDLVAVVGHLQDVRAQLLRRVVVELALLVHEVGHADLVPAHVEVVLFRLALLKLGLPLALELMSSQLQFLLGFPFHWSRNYYDL